ncbi:MAG: 5'-methylthioadenosine phosphorylase, partial [uncultured Solirubrobacteraceae bacterium]
GDRGDHRIRDLRAARLRRRGRRRAGRHAVGRGGDRARIRRRCRGPARLAPRGGPPAAQQPRRAPREHRRAVRGGRARGDRPDGVRGGRSRRGARVADLLRRPALPVQPPSRRRAVHALPARRRSSPGPLDLRAAVFRGAAHGAAGRREDRGTDHAPGRLLRPRGRAAVQHARRDPRPGRLRRHGGLPDRRSRDRPGRRGRAALRAGRVRDRPRQRRDGRADAGRTPARADRAEHRGLLEAPDLRAAGSGAQPRGAGRGRVPLRREL